jgi:CHC2 zinc finger/Toprim-like
MNTITAEELVAAIMPRLERVQGNGDNISARCPFTEHEDKNASFSLNKQIGLWMCHGCGRKGNAYQLSETLGCLPQTSSRPRSARIPAVDWGLGEAMAKYNIEVTATATVFTITDHEDTEHRRHARYHHGEPRFKFWDKDTGRRTYHAYVPDWPLMREWGAGCGIAYVVEGDRDALTLAAHGYPSVGVLGVEHFDRAVEDIAQPLKDMGIGALALTPDNDAAGINAVSEWMPKLKALGFVVGVRTLPESINNVPVKDTYDAFNADREHFDDLMFSLPVVW